LINIVSAVAIYVADWAVQHDRLFLYRLYRYSVARFSHVVNLQVS
jgi:hypothetical protein